MKGNKMLLSESLLAEVKSLIATRLGIDQDSIDIGVSVSTTNYETGERCSESRSQSRSYGWSETVGTTTTTTTEDKQHAWPLELVAQLIVSVAFFHYRILTYSQFYSHFRMRVHSLQCIAMISLAVPETRQEPFFTEAVYDNSGYLWGVL